MIKIFLILATQLSLFCFYAHSQGIASDVQNIKIKKIKTLKLTDNEHIVQSKLYSHANRLSVLNIHHKSDTIILSSQYSTINHKKWRKRIISDTIIIGNSNYYSFHNSYKVTEDYPIYIFYGDSTIYYSIKQRPQTAWFNKRVLVHTISKNNSIIGALTNNNITYLYYNSLDGRGENHIYCTKSSDNGYSWSVPNLSLHHNLKELMGCHITSKHNNQIIWYMLLCDRNNRAYISTSNDGGSSWSYPIKATASIKGNSFMMIAKRKGSAILFKEQHTHRIRIWHGTYSELISGGGEIVTITDGEELNIYGFSLRKQDSYYVLLRSNSDELMIYKIAI